MAVAVYGMADSPKLLQQVMLVQHMMFEQAAERDFYGHCVSVGQYSAVNELTGGVSHTKYVLDTY
jgi:hypothetical protein